jgi:hypothetical protein
MSCGHLLPDELRNQHHVELKGLSPIQQHSE